MTGIELGIRRGRLIVLAAPSGAGKTSLVRALLERLPELQFSVSYTTREPRAAERDGADYHFVSAAEFEAMRARDAFLEYARVFDHWYGTGRDEVNATLERGLSVLLEIDWQGARQVRVAAPEAISVFVLPPSMAELERRLRGRRTDTEATIQRRLGEARADMAHWIEFDHVLINDDLRQAAAELTAIVSGQAPRGAGLPAVLRRRIEAILAG